MVKNATRRLDSQRHPLCGPFDVLGEGNREKMVLFEDGLLHVDELGSPRLLTVRRAQKMLVGKKLVFNQEVIAETTAIL